MGLEPITQEILQSISPLIPGYKRYHFSSLISHCDTPTNMEREGLEPTKLDFQSSTLPVKLPLLNNLYQKYLEYLQ